MYFFFIIIIWITISSVFRGEVDESEKTEEDGSWSPEGDVLEDSHHVISVVGKGPGVRLDGIIFIEFLKIFKYFRERREGGRVVFT